MFQSVSLLECWSSPSGAPLVRTHYMRMRNISTSGPHGLSCRHCSRRHSRHSQVNEILCLALYFIRGWTTTLEPCSTVDGPNSAPRTETGRRVDSWCCDDFFCHPDYFSSTLLLHNYPLWSSPLGDHRFDFNMAVTIRQVSPRVQELAPQYLVYRI